MLRVVFHDGSVWMFKDPAMATVIMERKRPVKVEEF